jgi:hypothetical protein
MKNRVVNRRIFFRQRLIHTQKKNGTGLFRSRFYMGQEPLVAGSVVMVHFVP